MKKLGVLLLGLVLSIGAPLAAHGAETGTYTIRLNDDGPHTLTVKGKADQHVAGWGTAVPMYCYVWGGPQLRIMSFYVPRTGITKAGRAQVQWGNKLATDDILPPGVEETQTAGRVDLRFTGPGGRNVSGTIDLRVGNCYRSGIKVDGTSNAPPAKRAKVATKQVTVKGRTTKVTVRCPKKPAGACRGKLVLKHKKKVLAQRKYAVKAGKSKTLKVRLSTKGKRILNRQRPHRITVVLNPGKGVKNVTRKVRVR